MEKPKNLYVRPIDVNLVVEPRGWGEGVPGGRGCRVEGNKWGENGTTVIA